MLSIYQIYLDFLRLYIVLVVACKDVCCVHFQLYDTKNDVLVSFSTASIHRTGSYSRSAHRLHDDFKSIFRHAILTYSIRS